MSPVIDKLEVISAYLLENSQLQRRQIQENLGHIQRNYLLSQQFLPNNSILIPFIANTSVTNLNSDKTLFIAFNNCYILSPKSPQTLENAKFIASEFALMLSLVLYPFPSCYELS